MTMYYKIGMLLKIIKYVFNIEWNIKVDVRKCNILSFLIKALLYMIFSQCNCGNSECKSSGGPGFPRLFNAPHAACAIWGSELRLCQWAHVPTPNRTSIYVYEPILPLAGISNWSRPRSQKLTNAQFYANSIRIKIKQNYPVHSRQKRWWSSYTGQHG